MHKEYITKAKKTELEAELETLQTTERSKILKDLEYAKGLGDLKENAEYHEARDAQGKLEDRIKKIEYILRHAEIITEDQKFECATIGATVTVLNIETGEERTFTIVGPEETDVSLGKISHLSPVGQVMLGKCVGETFVFSSPKGDITYKVSSIQ